MLCLASHRLFLQIQHLQHIAIEKHLKLKVHPELNHIEVEGMKHELESIKETVNNYLTESTYVQTLVLSQIYD